MSDNGTVSTEDTPKDRPMNVVTSETEPTNTESSPASPSTDGQKTEKQADSDDKKTNDGEKRTSTGRRAKRKIDKLTRQNTEFSDRIAELQARLDAQASELAELKQSSSKASKPKRADFDSDEDYAEAHHEWKSKHSAPEPKKEPAKKADNQPTVDNPHAELISEINESGADRIEDWDEVWKKVPLNQQLAEALFEEDDPDLIADVLAHMHENYDDSVELFKATEGKPRTAAKRMDEIIEKVRQAQAETSKGGEKEGAKPEQGKKGPPEPANHINTGNETEVASGDITGNEGMDDYAMKRRKQERARRRH